MAKHVLITGGAKRLGKSMAMYFADQGYDLLIHVNKSISEGNTLLSELKVKYPKQRFNLFCFDLSQWRYLDQACSKQFKEHGLPDVIIHNASSYLQANLEHVTNKQMEEMMAIHLYAPMVVGRVYRQLGGTGHIISILDSAISTNNSSHGMYLLAKKSLYEYTKMSALEWAPTIRVNAIAPGPVLPPEDKDTSYFNTVVNKTPLVRAVSEEAINTSLDYLIKNESITGQVLFCDSGQHLI